MAGGGEVRAGARTVVAVGRIPALRGMAGIPPAPWAHERLSTLMPTMPLNHRSCTTHRNERFGMTSRRLWQKWGGARASEVVVGGQEREAGWEPLERTYFCWNTQLHDCPRSLQGAIRMGARLLLGSRAPESRVYVEYIAGRFRAPFRQNH